MRRLFWITLGATAGVLVVRKVTRAAESVTPEGAADRVSTGLETLADSVREFADEVRAGMAERDTELRQALGVTDDGAGVADLQAVDDIFRTTPRGIS